MRSRCAAVFYGRWLDFFGCVAVDSQQTWIGPVQAHFVSGHWFRLSRHIFGRKEDLRVPNVKSSRKEGLTSENFPETATNRSKGSPPQWTVLK